MRGTLQSVALVTVAVLLPLGTFMYLRMRSGRWSTIDASRPAERPPLYFVALSLAALAAAWFATSPGLGFLGRGGAAVCLLLVVAALLNRWIKTSLHVAFAAYAAAVLLFLNPPAGLAFLAFVPVLGWARLAMRRHSLPKCWSELLSADSWASSPPLSRESGSGEIALTSGEWRQASNPSPLASRGTSMKAAFSRMRGTSSSRAREEETRPRFSSFCIHFQRKNLFLLLPPSTSSPHTSPTGCAGRRATQTLSSWPA